MPKIFIKIILLLPLNLSDGYFESLLSSYGIEAKVQVIDLSEPLRLGQQKMVFYKLRDAFRSDKKTYVHVLTDPFLDDLGAEYMLGLTSHKSKFSYSVWNFENSLKINRVTHSVTALLHELGHNIGNLEHSTGCVDLMDSAAMACENIEQLRFSKGQLRRINK